MMTSAVSSWSVSAAFSTGLLKASTSAPACSRHFFAAFMIQRLVTVTPDTASTAIVCSATMAAGICSTAISPTPGVST